jgi:hypothetical protein
MNNRKLYFGMKFLGFALLFFIFAGGATMLLWNWLMPAIFGLPALSLLQAFGLLALSRILVGGFSRRRGWGGSNRHHHWKKRWANMSPEQREQWKAKMAAKWKDWGDQSPAEESSAQS